MTEGIFKNNPEFRAIVSLNREVRRVPLDWQHPKDADGNYLRIEEYFKFEDRWYINISEEEARVIFEEEKKHMMPDFSGIPADKMGVCAYESFTEGTPISPVFPDTPEGRFLMVKYCAENASITDQISFLGVKKQKADVVTWTNALFSEVPYALDINSGKIELE